MGANSSKESGKPCETEKLAETDNEDLESGVPRNSESTTDSEFSINVVENRVKSQEVVIDVPSSLLETAKEDSESRVSSGSESSDILTSGIEDDVINVLDPFNDLHSSSSESHLNPEFSTAKFLKNEGYDLMEPAIQELLSAKDSEEFEKIQKKILTPREMFEQERGPFPGDETVVKFPAPKREKSKKLEENLEDSLKTTSSSCSASSSAASSISHVSMVDAFGCPVTEDSESATSLFGDVDEDEFGVPKVNIAEFIEKMGDREETGAKNPLEPTIEDYLRDKDSSGQTVSNFYHFERGYNVLNEPTHWECLGPDGSRIQDFWTGCHDHEIGVISMFGEFHEGLKGRNCFPYIPEDRLEVFECGQIEVQRCTDPEWPNKHCKIQKFAVRCKLVPRDLGWYLVWHVRRDRQDDPDKDYSKENEEFHELKDKLLKDVDSTEWLEHGPMKFSPLRGLMTQGMNRTTWESTRRSIREKSAPEVERRLIDVD